MDGTLSASDAIALREGDGFGGGNAFFWVFALLLLGNGGLGWGGNRGDFVTSSELTSQINASQTQQGIQQVLLSSANNNYETAQLVNQQTSQLMAQNNTNLINAIQGFNSLQQQISSLGAHLDSCCCSIKTQMLQDNLDRANAKIVAQQNEINNAQQTQNILNALGRFVAWAGSGSQAATAAQG
jgi:hypothetical protein